VLILGAARAGLRHLCVMTGEPSGAATVGTIPAGRGGDDVPRVPNAKGNRLAVWFDALQRRHSLLGFPYAVVRKYGDDGGWRHAALITYYGFLSLFPILLVAASLLSTVLVNRPALREEMVAALVPPAVQSTVNSALVGMPVSGLPLVIGLVGLLLSGTGVVFSAYETLNHVAGVPRRCRFHLITRYARVLLMVVVVLVGGLAVAALTVASGVLPDELQRIAANLATAAVVFLVLVAASALLVARRIPLRTSVLPAAMGALVVTVVLAFGARLLGGLVARSGPVYGSFATVAGIFALMYLVSQALLYAAEVAVVRRRRLWPRAVVTSSPTQADIAALSRLATVQERIPIERIEVRFDASDTDEDRGGG
jgi:membrane protein